MNVYDKANELARALKTSEEVTVYKAALDKVEKNETSKRMLDDFRKKQMELYTLQMQGLEIPKEQIDSLNNLASVITMNQDIKILLEAEYKFSKLMDDIMKIIGEAVNVNITEDRK